MKTITLAYAFKLKAKWAGELKEAENQLIANNSIVMDNDFPMEMEELLNRILELKSKLTKVKIVIRNQSTPIIGKLIALEELKADLVFNKKLQGSTKEGTNVMRFNENPITYKSFVKIKDILNNIKHLTEDIFNMQHEIDVFNGKTKFEFEID